MGFPEMDQVRDHSQVRGLPRFLLYVIARHINNGDGSKYPGQTYVGRDKLMAAIGVNWPNEFYRLQKVLMDSGELIVETNAGPGRTHLRSLVLDVPAPAPAPAPEPDAPTKVDRTDQLDFCEHDPFHTYGNEDDCEMYDGMYVTTDDDGRKILIPSEKPEISDVDRETLAGRPTKADATATRTQREQATKQEKQRQARELAADHMS